MKDYRLASLVTSIDQRRLRRAIAMAVLIALLASSSTAQVATAAFDDPTEAEARMVGEAADAAAALGVYYDSSVAHFVIVVETDQRQEALDVIQELGALSNRVDIETRQITQEEIDEVTWRLMSVATADLGSEAYGFYFDPRSGLVVLESTAPASAFTKVLEDHLRWVDYHPGEGGRDTRHSDFSPFYGGAEVRDTVGSLPDCSTGFAVKDSSSVRRIVTAGHCFNIGNAVYSPGTGNLMGSIGFRATFPAKDMELIVGQSYAPNIYVGGALGGSKPVNGANDPVVGFSNYCRSGITTFETCGKTVSSLSGQLCDASGCTSSLAVYSGGVVAQGGDSGAPFYANAVSNTRVNIRGMHIGHFNSTEYAHKWSTIAATFAVSIVAVP